MTRSLSSDRVMAEYLIGYLHQTVLVLEGRQELSFRAIDIEFALISGVSNQP